MYINYILVDVIKRKRKEKEEDYKKYTKGTRLVEALVLF